MNAYEKSIALNLDGTDAEIVAALKSTGVTASKIDLAYLMELLNFRGMLRKTDGSGGQERWIGTLQNLKAALVALNQTAAVTAYETWFSHVTNPRQTHWDTSQPQYAAGFWAMRSTFVDGDGMPSSEDFAAVASLGGGWMFSELTVEQFATQRTDTETKVATIIARNNRRSLYDTFENAIGTSEQPAKIIEMRTMLDTLEASQ